MIRKTITLKFATRNETIVVEARDEKEFAQIIETIIRDAGAIGFGTQSSVVIPAR